MESRNIGVKTILVSGDVVMDHHIYAGERATPGMTSERGTREVATPDGAALAHAILHTLEQSIQVFLSRHAEEENTRRYESIEYVKKGQTQRKSGEPLSVISCSDKAPHPASLPFVSSFGMKVPDLEALPEALHCFAEWRPFQQHAGDRAEHPRKVWRVSQELGNGVTAGGGSLSCFTPLKDPKAPETPDIVLLADAPLWLRYK